MLKIIKIIEFNARNIRKTIFTYSCKSEETSPKKEAILLNNYTINSTRITTLKRTIEAYIIVGFNLFKLKMNFFAGRKRGRMKPQNVKFFVQILNSKSFKSISKEDI